MNINWCQQLGQYLGYPKCCVDEFIANLNNDERFKGKEDVIDNNGFIPCLKCCEYLRTSGNPISTLITDRKAKRPFPIFNEEDAIDFKLNHYK